MTVAQVGGTHYSSDYHHWTLMLKLRVPYHEGVATKYVTRWRKKGEGLLDLKKALSFLNKLEEYRSEHPESLPKRVREELPYIRQQVAEMCKANDLNDLERAFIERMCVWEQLEELAAARELLFLMMDEAEALAAEGARPVPLTEENHHADRYRGA